MLSLSLFQQRDIRSELLYLKANFRGPGLTLYPTDRSPRAHEEMRILHSHGVLETTCKGMEGGRKKRCLRGEGRAA